MVLIVILLNLVLVVINCYLVCKIRQWRQALKTTTQVLTRLERQIEGIFHPAPPQILRTQGGTKAIRLRSQLWLKQLDQITRLLKLFSWVYNQSMIKSAIKKPR